MALYSVIPIYSASVTVAEGSTTVNVTGGHNCGFVGSGSLVFIGDRPVADAISGTNADANGNATITLRRPWAYPTTTAHMTVAQTYEGMVDVTYQLKGLVEQAQANNLKIFEFKGNWDLVANNGLPPAPTTGSAFYRCLTGGTFNGTVYRAGELIYYDQYTIQWRGFWQGLGDAAFRSVSTLVENDQSKLMRIGFAGVGASLDLRPFYNDEFSTPQKCFGRGQIVGMMVGGPSGLNIPWLTDPSYGTLTINGSYGNFSAGTSITQTFNYAGSVFTRGARDALTWENWVKLDNNLDRMQDITDINGNKLMFRGALGIGATFADGTPVAEDANAIPTNGVYRYHNATAHKPLNVDGYGGIVNFPVIKTYQGKDYGFQIAGEYASTNLSVRHISDSIYYPWRRLYHEGNITGPVWQVGGMPTGAIIESGYNANGHFHKFAGGLMIAITEVELPAYSLNIDASIASPWPAGFSQLKAVTFSAIGAIGSGYQGDIGLVVTNGIWSAMSNPSSAILATYGYRSAVATPTKWHVVGYGTWY